MSPHVTSSRPQGFVLLVVSAISAALLLLTGYLLEQARSEIKIAGSERQATTAYYLAEAGSNDAIYKLKNDATWKAKFLAGTLNNDTSTRNNVLGTGGSYTIAATSVSSALADITITATYGVSGQQAKRVIKTRFARATGSTPDWNQSVYTGGGGGNNGFLNFDRDCSATGGTLHANQNFKVKKATLDVYNGKITSSNNIIENAGGHIVLHNSTKEEGVDDIDMPVLDVDSASATSLKNRANQIYTSTNFTNLPSGTVLNGITFISGNATWTNKDLTINGILVSSGTMSISLSGAKTLTVNSGATGSGLVSKTTINLTLATNSTANISGLLYGADTINYSVTNSSLNITGGSMAYRTGFAGSGGTCSIVYDQNLVSTPLDPVLNGNESPIIQVNHWEEEY